MRTTGLVPYGCAWRLQQALVAQRITWQKEDASGHDALLVLEHESVYTLGRSAKAEDVRFPLEGIDDPAASAKRGFDVRTRVASSVISTAAWVAIGL